MTRLRGDFIPPVSDYAHWNEDAQRIWYEENKYDMEHWDEPVEDNWYEDRDYSEFYEEIPEDKCWELNRHYESTSGRSYLFGPNYDTIVNGAHDRCDDCGIDLVCDWVPNGYKVTRDTMMVYDEMYSAAGRKHYVPYDYYFPVYEKL